MARTRGDRRRIPGALVHTPGARAGTRPGERASSHCRASRAARSFSSAAARKAKLWLVGVVVLALDGALAGGIGWLLGLGFWWPCVLGLVAVWAFASGHVHARRGPGA